MSYALNKLRILVVDENSHIRQLLRTILQSVGVGSIQLSSDAVEGFNTYCQKEFDVVFTDSDVKPISGLGLVDLIRTSPKSPNPYVPIIMLSTFSDLEEVKEARDHGVTEFLAKPFTVDFVLKRLEAVIENPRSFVRTDTYFGPDRRRKADPNYDGEERRKKLLSKKKLTREQIAEKQQAALDEHRQAVEEMAKD